jgi:hypothetical protein
MLFADIQRTWGLLHFALLLALDESHFSSDRWSQFTLSLYNYFPPEIFIYKNKQLKKYQLKKTYLFKRAITVFNRITKNDKETQNSAND